MALVVFLFLSSGLRYRRLLDVRRVLFVYLYSTYSTLTSNTALYLSRCLLATLTSLLATLLQETFFFIILAASITNVGRT